LFKDGAFEVYATAATKAEDGICELSGSDGDKHPNTLQIVIAMITSKWRPIRKDYADYPI